MSNYEAVVRNATALSASVNIIPARTGYTEEDIEAAKDEGKQAEYDRFWDAFQNNGTKKSYYRAFTEGNWTDTCYNPKYPIICEGTNAATQTFYNATALTDIKVPVYLKNTAASYTFASRRIVTIPLLSLEGVTSFSQCFLSCQNLENITIEGSIDVNFDISATAVLSDTSVQSIIDHLATLDVTTATLTLHTDVKAKLTDAQIATITTTKGWTLA